MFAHSLVTLSPNPPLPTFPASSFIDAPGLGHRGQGSLNGSRPWLCTGGNVISQGSI